MVALPSLLAILPCARRSPLAHLLGGHHGVGQAVVIAARVLLVHQVTHIKVLDLLEDHSIA